MIAGRSIGVIVLAATFATVVAGPFDIPLFNTPKAPAAQGRARLVFAPSPFGVAVTADGRASYDVQLDITGLPEPSSLGEYSAYAAWAVTTDLARWYRLGTVTNGKSTVGHAELNKFLLVITAASSAPNDTSHAGPTVLHGTSPSGWLQSFLSHPLFRGIPP
ncbi:MAG TPA: hypothetical protein VII52_14845 [Gemmatimonadaceae bacterium]